MNLLNIINQQEQNQEKEAYMNQIGWYVKEHGGKNRKSFFPSKHDSEHAFRNWENATRVKCKRKDAYY